jgi:2-oxoglutarate ferredoxin oxidoreductase subunit gamma
MTEKVICCGSGGQGILVMGKFLANLALESGRFTTYIPAYGTEVRGGTAHCMINISDQEIYTPYIEKADTVIIMNEPSMIKFRNSVKKGGLMLLNKSLISTRAARSDIKKVWIPFSEMAADLGNIKCANTVALGAYLYIKKIASSEEISNVLNSMLSGLSADIFEVNQKAFKEGFKYGESK